MDELNIGAMIELQERLTKKLLSPAITGEERKQTLGELKVISETIDNYMKTANEQDRVCVERERIDADIRRSEIEATVKNRDSKRGLVGNFVKGFCQMGSSLIGAGATVFTVVKIVGAENDDRLVLSKALSFIPKFRG